MVYEYMDHFNDHGIGMEIDHLSALTRLVIRAYLAVCIETCEKRYLQQDDCTWEHSIIPP